MGIQSQIGGLAPFLSSGFNITPVNGSTPATADAGGSTGVSATAAQAPSLGPNSVASQQQNMGIAPTPAPTGAPTQGAGTSAIMGLLGNPNGGQAQGAGTNMLLNLLTSLAGG